MLKPIRIILAASLMGAIPFALPINAAPASVTAAQSQTTATVVVLDELGDPMIGATVQVANNPAKGGATDLDGQFSLANVSIGTKLKISAIGYKDVVVEWKGEPIEVQLELDSQVLGEVVVTAMGIQRKATSLTYATQQIKGDELMKVQDANFVNALSGKVSGVTITQSAGGAGGTSKILLRGNKSVMGSNDPLIVVDGIPMTNQAKGQGSNWSDGSSLGYSSSSEGGDALSLINPDDIESINVLKGANAAALYGSAAANGVLMITTKKGKEGKLNISFNSNVTFDTPLATPDIQYVYGTKMQNDVNGNPIGMSLGGWGKKIGTYTDAELGYANSKLTNVAQRHVENFFETGTTWNNSFAISGGTQKARSYFSYSNSNSDGMMPNNNYNRNTVSFRQNFNFFDNILRVDLSLNYVHAKTDNRPGGGTTMNPLYDLYRLPGNADLNYYRNNYMIENGKWQSSNQIEYIKNGKKVSEYAQLSGPMQNWFYPSTPDNNNPYWTTGMNTNSQVEERVYGSAVVSLEPIPGLLIQGRLNFDRSKLQTITNRYATTQLPSAKEDFGMYGNSRYTSNDWYVDIMASYNKTFNDLYSVSASTGWVGHTVKSDAYSQWIQATYFDPYGMNQLPELVNYFHPSARYGSNGISQSNGSNWDKGWFATGQFGYNDMVFVEGSYRIDWYRAFLQFAGRGTPDHYGYWSVGANTLMHKYLPMPEFISNLKLRASYSEVGNSIPNQVFAKATVNKVTGAVSTPAYGYFENPRPETSKSFEVGYDVSLFRSTLNWDLTYYNTNLTNSYFLAATTGGKSKPVNTGSIRNQGFETTLSYDLLAGNDWMWRSSFNLSYNDNKIEKTYLDQQGNPAKMEQLIANGSIAVRYAPGGQYGDIYALDFKRNDDGSIYIDPQHGVPTKSQEDWVYLGNMNSKWNLGWSNTIQWKDLSLYFLISGRIGGKFISLTEAHLDNLGMSQRSADARLAAEAQNIMWTSADGSVTKPGMYVDGTLVPVEDYYKTVGGQTFASEYVYDATNFRLGEVSISYTLRNLFKGAIKGLTLSATARNLFFIYKEAPADPDLALSTANGLGAFDIFNMPSNRSYGINLKVEF